MPTDTIEDRDPMGPDWPALGADPRRERIMSSSQHSLESQFAEAPALDATAAGSLDQLHGDQDEITAVARAVRTVAPWAKDPRLPLTNHGIGLAIGRCRALLVARYQSPVQHLGDEHLPAARPAGEFGCAREGLLEAEAGVELELGDGRACPP